MSRHALPLVLASASPRRLELLKRLGLELSVEPAVVDETPEPDEPPALHVQRVALAKARAVAARHPELPVLAADTVVVLGPRILGKPADRAEAAGMLRDLAGRSHLVLTAMAAAFSGHEATHLESARVTFVPWHDELYRWYLETGEGDDKAGSYAVQGRGALLVERVEGNVQAVVGLPLAPLPALLGKLGLHLTADGPRFLLTTGLEAQRPDC
jgi:septum formation protein